MTLRIKIHTLTIFLFFSVMLSPVSAQRLWLRADAGITTSNTGGVSNWQSQTSNGFEGTQSNTSAQPLLIDDGLNFNPTVVFDGSDDYLPLTINETAREIDHLYVAAVIKTDFTDITDDQSNWAILDFDRSDFFSFSVSNRVYLALNSYTTIRDMYGNQTVNDGIPHIVTGTFDSSDEVNDVRLYVDGGLDMIGNAYGHSLPVGRNRVRYGYVGDGSEAASFDGEGNDKFYDGEIAEIFYFRWSPLTNRKQIEINTYLAIKYGITLAQPNSYQISNNVLVWDKDQTYASKYNHAIAGIIRDDAYTLDQRISKSVNPDAMLTIALDNDFTSPNLDHTSRTTSFTTDLTGLIWGHNGVSKNRYETAVINNNRFTLKKRIWYAVDTNFDTNVHLMFSDESIVNGASYYLISESDGDGNFSNDGVISSGVVASNNSVTFSNVNVSDKYFTIADKIPNKYMRHGKFFRDGIEQQMKTSE